MSVSSFKSMNALRAPLLNYTATKKIYNLSLHDALPISPFLLNYVNNAKKAEYYDFKATNATTQQIYCNSLDYYRGMQIRSEEQRLNSSHVRISYAVFCLKKTKGVGENLSHRDRG